MVLTVICACPMICSYKSHECCASADIKKIYIATSLSINTVTKHDYRERDEKSVVLDTFYCQRSLSPLESHYMFVI